MNEERVPKLILAKTVEHPMSAIILFGGMSCGKSSVLQHLMVLLCGGGKRVPAIQAAFEEAFYDKKHDRYRDADVIITYRTKTNIDIPIYLSTDGDSWPVVEDNFRFFYHCIRIRKKCYEFNGIKFVEVNSDELMSKDKPVFCITPANFTEFGGTQAARYYLDLTCEDWRREYWIRKNKNPQPGKPVPGYNKPRIKRIKEEDAKMAIRFVELIDQMIVEKYL